MNISVLIRLLTDGLAEGRVAGHAEVVDTGETLVFKDQDEMLAFLHQAGARGTGGIGPIEVVAPLIDAPEPA
jgi:hypothetical protein